MNESQVRNLTPKELVNAFECEHLSDENIKQAFAILAEEFESAVSGEESAEDKLESASDRVTELVDAMNEALEMDDIDELKQHLRDAL